MKYVNLSNYATKYDLKNPTGALIHKHLIKKLTYKAWLKLQSYKLGCDELEATPTDLSKLKT